MSEVAVEEIGEGQRANFRHGSVVLVEAPLVHQNCAVRDHPIIRSYVPMQPSIVLFSMRSLQISAGDSCERTISSSAGGNFEGALALGDEVSS